MYKVLLDDNNQIASETQLPSVSVEHLFTVDAIYPIGTPVKEVNEIFTIDPHPDDGKAYNRVNGVWIEDTNRYRMNVAKIDPVSGQVLQIIENHVFGNSEEDIKDMISRGLVPTSPLKDNNGDVLNKNTHVMIPGMFLDITDISEGKVSQPLLDMFENIDIPGMAKQIENLVNKNNNLPQPSREDIFTSANKPSVQGDYFTMKPLTDFEYLGFLWRSNVKGNREEELLIPTRVFLALPTVPIGHWVLNPVSSVTKNRGVNSFCVCPIAGETYKVRISRVNHYFLESIWGYK